MGQPDTWEVINDALECKVPARIPTFLLGADWDFMERFIAEVGFTYEEFIEFKRDRIPFMCPTHIALAIKLNVDIAWMTPLGQLIWLDDLDEIGMMHGGRIKVVNRMSDYHPANPPEGWKKHPIPHLWYYKEGLFNKEQIKKYMDKKIKYSKREFKQTGKIIEVCEKKYNLIVSAGLTGPWEQLHFGIGFANVAKFWRKDRKFLHEIKNFHLDYLLKGVEDLVKCAKPKVVMIGDDYGFNQGLQMSLEMWRELVKPGLAEYVKIIHDGGAKCLLHSCGNIGQLFGDFVEIGLDGIESLKPYSNDLVSLKQKYGDKLCFLGTIDDSRMLNFSSPSEVKQSVTQSIKDLGPGGYIPGATNFLLDQPVDNVYAMFEAIRNYKIN